MKIGKVRVETEGRRPWRDDGKREQELIRAGDTAERIDACLTCPLPDCDPYRCVWMRSKKSKRKKVKPHER